MRTGYLLEGVDSHRAVYVDAFAVVGVVAAASVAELQAAKATHLVADPTRTCVVLTRGGHELHVFGDAAAVTAGLFACRVGRLAEEQRPPPSESRATVVPADPAERRVAEMARQAAADAAGAAGLFDGEER